MAQIEPKFPQIDQVLGGSYDGAGVGSRGAGDVETGTDQGARSSVM